MALPIKISQLNKSDAAYIAGLIDGEGTVTLVRKHKNEYRQLCISISSTEIALLYFVKHATNVGKITNKRTSKPHHTPSFAYAVYNRQALGLLSQILPHLRSYKLERAKLIINSYLRVTPRNGKYSTELLIRKHEFERQVLSIKPNQRQSEVHKSCLY
jgi:hypothetical protein